MKKANKLLGLLILLVILAACSVQGKDYTAPNGTTYKFKLELTGTLPNASKQSTFIILSNDNTLTFEKVASSMLSSNSSAHKGIDFYLLPSQ